MLRIRSLVAAVLLVALVSLASAPAFAAPKSGKNGWYWPTGKESFTGSGWWDVRGRTTRHLAQDMRGSVGQAVYAVADGYVLESKMARGYGRGGSRGGAVVIQHRTGDGTKFTALYGHLKGLKYKKGQKVKAGAVIGYLNNARPPHLHFGIRLGWGLPEDRNPFRGHTHTTKKTYGFVDPIAFLRKHHRLPKPAPAPVAPPVEPPPPADVTPPLDPPSPTDGGAPPLEADAAVAPSGSGD